MAEIYFLQFWRLEVWNQGAKHDQILLRILLGYRLPTYPQVWPRAKRESKLIPDLQGH